MPSPTLRELRKFQRTVWDFYDKNKRAFAWRETTDPYQITVSEIMLQQTQTERVAKKFPEFLAAFSTWKKLADAPLPDLLRVWQGMGYNRRAIALQKIAVRVVNEFEGQLPNNPEILETFPGIGPNTAGSICAFAFNAPTVFIETNIRAVFLHHFFADQTKVHDKELLPIVEAALVTERAREWYYALMDYGVYLKKLHKNPARRSAHHARQSAFEGSDRQIRSGILKLLLKMTEASLETIFGNFPDTDNERVERLLGQLVHEGFVANEKGIFCIRSEK